VCCAVSLICNHAINPAITTWKDGVQHQDKGQYVSERYALILKKSVPKKK
jgi:hypothetical protein